MLVIVQNYCSLNIWALFEGVHNIIPLRDKMGTGVPPIRNRVNRDILD